MSNFTKPFEVKVHNLHLRDRPFEVLREVSYYSNIDGVSDITVPVGFRTDFATIPRPFSGILFPVGRYSKAALIHDYLVSRRSDTGYSIKLINNIFKEAMKVLKVKKFNLYLIYWSVVLWLEWVRPLRNKIIPKYKK